MTLGIPAILESLGVNPSSKTPIPDFQDHWDASSFKNNDGQTTPYPVLLIDAGPKNIAEAKKIMTKFPSCVVLFRVQSTGPYTMFLKAGEQNTLFKLENSGAYDQIQSILNTFEFTKIKNKFDMMKCIQNAIKAAPTHTSDFDNRGVFSTHYLKNRLFKDVPYDVKEMAHTISENIKTDHTTEDILTWLGWKNLKKNDSGIHHINDMISIIVSEKDGDLGTKRTDGVAPSYVAVSELKNSTWVILTNGTHWRLYTSKISAVTTNYFEINLGLGKEMVFEYLVAIFGILAYQIQDGKTTVDRAFDEGRTYARELEEDLASKILTADGIFLDLVKGVLDHDMKRKFRTEEMESAKNTSLKIMYRIWFLLYAESRDLLPIKDEKYRPISLQLLRTKLDSMEEHPDDHTCWTSLLNLFGGIRNGSVKNNLPQYNGDLFRTSPAIDDINIRNRFIIPALRGLFEKDGEPMDYASLSVRHLGSIYETLMAFTVRQADKDVMLLEDRDGVREVSSSKDSTYSYKKNDLYLASKGGIASRKTSASFYTPDEIVKFLVNRGLGPIFRERGSLIKKDMAKYLKDKSEKNRQICMERLLDLQVLDPSMGSGHFLVEALNRITQWATNILDENPCHPLLEDIEHDRLTVISEQKKKGITLEESLLTHDVLLKRKIMKRCIFGVDVNPMAVDLAKLSLWLDSFAIGVPLTYMDHHIKTGDSTIGMFLDDLKKKTEQSLDDFVFSGESNKMISDVISSSDITVDQVHQSEDNYNKYVESLAPHKRVLNALTASKIDPKFFPKTFSTKRKNDFIHKFGNYSKDETPELKRARKIVSKLAERHKFFHWEIEMMDAFTSARRGFDVIVGNPPWEKVKPSDDEFFTPYDPAFKSLKPNTKKIKRMEELLKDPEINNAYKSYKNLISEKTAFYKIYGVQGSGDKDLWKLILERTLNLLGEGGIISMVIPSQILSTPGTADMRKSLLEKDILSLYVFENKYKIFQIHSSYRFILLSVRNSEGPDEFPAGFYLHNLKSLEDRTTESEKFGILSRQKLLDYVDHIIPEKSGYELEIYEKISQNNTLGDGLGGGWSVGLTRGFDKTNDADLLKEDGKGWPVYEGKTMHQYNHKWMTPVFTANKKDGLERESGRKIFQKNHKEIYDSFRLIFRNISRSTDMRTSINTIIPPHQFYTHSLYSMVLTRDGNISLGAEYDRKMAYLCGMLNSLTFDFACRAKIQTNLASILKSLPIPNLIHEDRISKLAAKLVVGTPEFEGFADSLRIPNVTLTPAQRIETAAELDALVALQYGLTKSEYKTIIDSFPAFKKNPSLYDTPEIVWDNKNLKEFYGEMADLALEYFEEISND